MQTSKRRNPKTVISILDAVDIIESQGYKVERLGYGKWQINSKIVTNTAMVRIAQRILNKNAATKNSTSTEVRSPTSTETSTEAYTKDNVTVTGGAGAGATTKVTIIKKNPSVYKGYILKRNKKGHVLVYRKGSDIVIMGAVNMAIAKKMIDATSKKNPKVTGAVGNPRYIKGDDKHLLNELIDEVRSVKMLWWTALSMPERKLATKHSEIFKIGKINNNKFVELKSTRNSTAADFKQHQKLRLADLIKMFQGEHKGEKKRVVESDYTPKDKYKLGYLVQMKIKDAGKTIPISFDGESYLAADMRNNLLVVGKDSRLTGVKLPPKGHLKYLGELVQFDYVTAKKHIGGGKTIRFYHKTGEVTGEHPNLLMDNEGFLIIQGGGYDIWDVGVVN